MNGEQEFLLITGASSGLGREMAIRLSAGRRLVLAGRNAERLEAVRAACDEPDRHLLWRCDLANVEALSEELGRFLQAADAHIAGMVHSAARLDVLPLRSLTPSLAEACFRTNVLSAFELVRLLTKKTVNQHHLRAVVFISSIASKFGAKGFSAYSASKGALDALMRSLAVELAPRVRLNSVLPGALRTEMTASMFDDPGMSERLEADYPLGTGVPSDIADLVEFLLSDRARWITGQQLVADGGRSVNITA